MLFHREYGESKFLYKLTETNKNVSFIGENHLVENKLSYYRFVIHIKFQILLLSHVAIRHRAQNVSW